MSEKPAHAEAVENALARAWCPLKGLDCKDMGENTFLFTFHQPSGKRKAIEDGLWEFGKSLLVVEEFVPSKTLKEYEFRWIPVWVRIFNLPLGMMCREAGEAIGGFMGETLEVDVGPDGMVIGSYLRVKVKLDIQEPLMRGFTREEDEEEKKRRRNKNDGDNRVELWCRFEYEFLPDFCYTCGRLGHIDKECGIKLKKGEDAQYGAWMKAFIPRISSDGYRSIRNEERSVWGGRSGRGGGNMSSGAYRSNSRSDSGSWRKNVTLAVKDGGQKNHVEEEVTSPFEGEIDGETKDSKNGEAAGEKVDETDIVMLEQGGDSGKTQVEELRVEGQDKKEADESIPNNNLTGKQGSKFKRQRRDGVKGNQQKMDVHVGRKRQGEDMEVEGGVMESLKKSKGYTRERLDRAVACNHWRGVFPLYKVINGDPRHSDHQPIIVMADGMGKEAGVKQGGGVFQFKAKWLLEEDCARVVEEAWNAAFEEGSGSVQERLNKVGGELTKWDREVLGELKEHIKKARRELEQCRRGRLDQQQINRDKLRSTDDILHNIQRHLQDYKGENKVQPGRVNVQKDWQPPPTNSVKVNFDAAFYEESGRGAWGCVIRDDQGVFLAAKAGTLEHLSSPLHAEALACVKATEASAELGVHRLVLESDCQVLVKALHTDDRDCNKAAHELAAYSFRVGAVDLSWIDQAPDFISAMVVSDMAVRV
ncbi:retrotransposon unclassified [Hordeum vulgare]|nr:retrotransposon unclassified [Hordeum vulgare]